MSAPAGLPVRALAATFAAAALGLAVTVPISRPGGGGAQWDNLVLGAVSAVAAWLFWVRLRAVHPGVRRPWYALALASAFVAVAGLATGAGLSADFGGLGLGDLSLVVAAVCPLVTCVLLTRQVGRTRRLALAVDGAMVCAALLVVTHAFVWAPVLRPGVVATGSTPLVLVYAGYAALATGLAGALCSVSTAALRRSSTAMLVTVLLAGAASSAMAVNRFAPLHVWSAVAALALVGALLAGVAAAWLAPADPPSEFRGHPDNAPRVGATAVAIVLLALAGPPVVLLVSVLTGRPLGVLDTLGTVAVLVLMLVRTAMRTRDRDRLTEDLVRSEEDFRGLVEASSDGVAIVDDEFRLVFTSPAARHLLGVPAEPGPRTVLLDLLPADERDRVRRELSAPALPGVLPLQLRVTPAVGEPRDLEITHHERPGSGRRVLHLRDVTVRRRRERELERMAFTDHLTRLPNRAMLFQELTRLAHVDTDRCLLVLDLDGFKAVNDTVGHEAGDRVLVEVARRLQGILRAEDLVARLGGDEFAVLIAGDRADGVDTAQRIVDVLAHPHRLPEGTFPVGASVGLTQLVPGGGRSAFREADAALRAAKQAGKGCLRVWTSGRDDDLPVSGDLVTALLDGEVQLRYDISSTADGERAVLHAAPVWEHPTAGLLSAADVWGAAGRQGRTAALQHWLLHRACAETTGLTGSPGVVVDLPAGHTSPDDLTGDVLGALAAADLPASRLTLALTEEALLTAPASLPAALREVRAAGVRVCLDDYGMGQTLFAHLSRVPLDSVRVDIDALGARGDAARAVQIVSAIVGTSRALGLATAVHGVDPGPTLDAVLAAGASVVRSSAHPHRVGIEDVAGAVAALLRRPDSSAVRVAGPILGG